MGAERGKETPGEMVKVRGELEAWRGQRRPGERIPEELWAAAVKMARRHGLNRVSRALGLDYYHLKKRTGVGGKKSERHEEVFAELQAAVSESGGTCVVELEKGNGAKLRVSVSDAATVDWCRLKEAFLGA